MADPSYPHYHLPYRGLPPEIRIQIWRHCDMKKVTVRQPEKVWSIDAPDVMFDDSEVNQKTWTDPTSPCWERFAYQVNQFQFGDPPNLATLRLNKQVHAEVTALLPNPVWFDIRQLSPMAEIAFLSRLGLPKHWGRPGSADPHMLRLINGIDLATIIEDDATFRECSHIGGRLRDLIAAFEVPHLAFEIDTSDNPLVTDFHDGLDVVNVPQILDQCREVWQKFWSNKDAEFVAALLSNSKIVRSIQLTLISIPPIMKRVVRDGGWALLEFDRSCADCRSRVQLSATTYSNPSAIRIKITKKEG